MGKRTLTLTEAKAELKALGYRTRVKHHSEFSALRVFAGDVELTGANVITPEFLDEHAAFFDWRNKGVSVADDGWRYVV